MGIQFFEQPSESVDLEFASNYLEANPKQNGKIFDLVSVKKAKSGKGYMLYTSDFIVWYYRKEKVLQQILEALDIFCKVGGGKQFVIQLDKTASKKFNIGIDEEREATYIPLENASYVLQGKQELEGIKKEKKEVNPFLKNLPSLPTLSEQSQTTLQDLDSNPKGRKGREAI